MKRIRFLFVGIVVCLAAHNGAYASVITPTGVTSTSQIDANRDIGFTISGAGLSGGGAPILDQTHNINVNGTYWLGALGDNQVLTFDLGGATSVGGVHIWQYQRDNQWDDRSFQSFDIAFSTDNGATYPTTIPGLSGLLGSQTDPISNPVPVQTLQFVQQSGVTHVQLSNIANFGDGSWLGLAEIRFETEGVPEPSTFTLAALGLLGLLGWRRRRR